MLSYLCSNSERHSDVFWKDILVNVKRFKILLVSENPQFSKTAQVNSNKRLRLYV